MLRQKTAAEVTRARLAIAKRLVALRSELCGEHGSTKMAKWLGVPARSWYSYERGMAIPGLLILKIVVETSVEPMWLLHGTGPKYRPAESHLTDTSSHASMTVSSLLGFAISQLDQEQMTESIPA